MCQENFNYVSGSFSEIGCSMKILLLTQVLPYPPDSGPKVKTWNVIKYLAKHHEVTLVSFVRGDQAVSVRELEKYCREVHTVPLERGIFRDLRYMAESFLRNQPFLMIRDRRREMEQLIDQLSAKTDYDIVHADQLNMAQYAARVTGARQVLDAHNALWLLYKRLWMTMGSGPKKWLLKRDWRLLKKYEGQVCKDFHAVLAVSEEDRKALEEAAGQSLNITVIPIAIDTDEITPVDFKAQGNRIIHIGTMFWPPNIDGIMWFLQEVLPKVRESRADAVFDVIGANPPQEIISMGEKDPGVNITGYVDDLMPYLEGASVMVVPLRAGGGMRVKILNALGQGLPIVSTTLGCEGIGVTSGVHLLISDSPEEFAHSVVCLMEDDKLARKLGQNGRRLIEESYDYRSACQWIEGAYSKA
jgi:polysaccharide biosynthesis protein PslH